MEWVLVKVSEERGMKRYNWRKVIVKCGRM